MDVDEFLKRKLDSNISAFQAMRYSPDAIPGYDILADAVYWPDELPVDRNDDIVYVMRYLLHARLQIARGKRPKASVVWEYFRSRIPSWPGFRPERSNADLLALYDRLKVDIHLPDH